MFLPCFARLGSGSVCSVWGALVITGQQQLALCGVARAEDNINNGMTMPPPLPCPALLSLPSSSPSPLTHLPKMLSIIISVFRSARAASACMLPALWIACGSHRFCRISVNMLMLPLDSIDPIPLPLLLPQICFLSP